MRVIYADPALATNIGHHAMSCREITAALRERGHEVDILAYREIEPALAQELGARPHFRLNTYWGNDGDPICGWLNAFFIGANVTAQDLAAGGPFGPDCLLYMNSIKPAQLLALRSLLLGLPDGLRPQVFAEFGTAPGLDHVPGEGGGQYVARDPRLDATATLYRFAGAQIAAQPLPQLHLCSFDRTCSDAYAMLLGRPVQTLPVPRFADARARRRGAARPLTIGVLGHQRGEKGYQLVPDIVSLLLRVRGDIRFLVHNAQPNSGMRSPGSAVTVQDRMRTLAASDARVVLDERAAGAAHWQALLDQCDLMLCPYDPVAFRIAYSAVTSEAIANAIPSVVPENTTLAQVMGAFGMPGVMFGAHSAPAIAVAVNDALEQFDTLATRAVAAAEQWHATMGAGATVDAMLAEISGGEMLARLAQRTRPAHSYAPIEKVA